MPVLYLYEKLTYEVFLAYHCVSKLNYANGFFIQCLKTVALNEATAISSCKPQSQINLYEPSFTSFEVMEIQCTSFYASFFSRLDRYC